MKAWNHNVVAMGLASGFTEPRSPQHPSRDHAVVRLVQMFPSKASRHRWWSCTTATSRAEMEHVRDF